MLFKSNYEQYKEKFKKNIQPVNNYYRGEVKKSLINPVQNSESYREIIIPENQQKKYEYINRTKSVKIDPNPKYSNIENKQMKSITNYPKKGILKSKGINDYIENPTRIRNSLYDYSGQKDKELPKNLNLTKYEVKKDNVVSANSNFKGNMYPVKRFTLNDDNFKTIARTEKIVENGNHKLFTRNEFLSNTADLFLKNDDLRTKSKFADEYLKKNQIYIKRNSEKNLPLYNNLIYKNDLKRTSGFENYQIKNNEIKKNDLYLSSVPTFGKNYNFSKNEYLKKPKFSPPENTKLSYKNTPDIFINGNKNYPNQKISKYLDNYEIKSDLKNRMSRYQQNEVKRVFKPYESVSNFNYVSNKNLHLPSYYDFYKNSKRIQYDDSYGIDDGLKLLIARHTKKNTNY